MKESQRKRIPIPTKSSGIPADVLLLFSIKFLHEVIHHPIIKILTSQVGISYSGFHLEDSLFNRQNRNIKRPSSQIKYQHILFFSRSGLLIKPISNGSSSGLIDNPQHIHPSNETDILSRMSLQVIEIGRNSNHNILHSLSKKVLSNLLHLGEHH